MTSAIAPPPAAIAGLQDLLHVITNADQVKALVNGLEKATAEYIAAKDEYVALTSQQGAAAQLAEDARAAAEKAADKAEKAQAKADAAKAELAAERAELAAVREQLETDKLALATSQKAFDALVRDRGAETETALAAAKAAQDEAEKLRSALSAKLAVLQEPV